MTAEECLEVLESYGYKRNGMGGISGKSKGVDFTVCEHMFKGICIMGHSVSKDGRSVSGIEEYVQVKNLNKVSFAGWFCSIIDKYSYSDLLEVNKRAEDILGEGIVVFRRLNEEIEQIGKTSAQEQAYTSIPRMMLMDSLILATEVIYSLKDQRLLISLIGLRSLFETLINIAYIYAHPKHKSDLSWSTGLCKDCIERANDPDALKSQLGEVSIAKRAKEVGLEAHYKDIIGGLSNFTHMIGFCPTQNDPKKTQKMYRSAYVQVLTAMLDIYQVLQNHFKLQKAEEWKGRVEDFLKDYAVSING